MNKAETKAYAKQNVIIIIIFHNVHLRSSRYEGFSFAECFIQKQSKIFLGVLKKFLAKGNAKRN